MIKGFISFIRDGNKPRSYLLDFDDCQRGIWLKIFNFQKVPGKDKKYE